MKSQTLLVRLLSHVALLTIASCAVSTLGASTLMFDFGTAIATGDDRSNSPLHTADSSFTSTTWNSINTTGTGAKTGFVYADGTAATGVSLYVGRSSNNAWGTLTFAGGPTNVTSTSNPAALDGVFANSTSIGRDGHYAAAGTGDLSPTRLMGVSIGGLSAGTYEIYLVGMNPNLALSTAAGMGFWAVELSGTANYDATTLVNAGAQASTSNSVSSSWIEGSNYGKLTITLSSSSSYLTLISLGTTEAEQRGFINAIQIVAIPEPAHAVGVFAVVALGGAFVRRQRRSVVTE
jgi:hypothetical protein